MTNMFAVSSRPKNSSDHVHAARRHPVGFVGIGSMGASIARCLLESGQNLLVLPGPHGRNADLLAEAGAKIAKNKSELAACELVFTCLPSSAVVASLADEVLLSFTNPGFTHFDLTAGDPQVTTSLAARYAASGRRLVDIGVVGTPEQALSGGLTLLVGAHEEELLVVRPSLAPIAGKLFPMGAPGNAHRAKLIMGFVGMAMATASSEALAAARLAGIDLAVFASLIGGTGMNSATFQAMAAAAIDGDESRRKLSIANASKDLGYVNSLMQELGLNAPVAGATSASLRSAVESGLGSQFVTALTRVKLEQAGATANEAKPRRKGLHV